MPIVIAGPLRTVVGALFLCCCVPAAAGDAAFRQWLEALWPQAQAAGVTRTSYERETRGLEPDLTLPDLAIPGRPPPAGGQPEFVQSAGAYLRATTLTALAAEGRALRNRHRGTLDAIERRFGVAPSIVLAIWARETAYGRHPLRHDAIRALATQAYLGRRKERFLPEFILALKMLQDGAVKRADMRSSWAGAMGLTQFLPSEFYKQGVDFDADGRVDIWRSVPDALASAAKQLVDKGWQPGKRWAYEVKAPRDLDCTLSDPDRKMPVDAWLAMGFVPADGRTPGREERSEPASLLLPEGTYGPAFLTPKNYFVIKEYNFADLYVLFVGNLSDRIEGKAGFATPWANVSLLRSRDVEAVQRVLAARGLYTDKIDGKAGMKTRGAVGAYQKANGLKTDCWPSPALLAHMRSRAR
jgi:lytic murein transglycosylase